MTTEELYELISKSADRHGFKETEEIGVWLLNRYPELKEDFHTLAIKNLQESVNMLASFDELIDGLNKIQDGMETASTQTEGTREEA